ncbi:MAG: hypothetical protein SFH39_01545 [Candidatus Magnetobacterium sp. LHC-1]|nr:hypothetical protein [Nitrospirota bacterium]
MPKKIKKKHASRHAQLVETSREQEKMSGVLLDYAKPLLVTTKTTEETKKALDLSLIFWNASFLPDDKQKETLESLVKEYTTTKKDKIAARELFAFMINRKLTEFSDIDRLIMAYDFTEDDNGGFHIQVASTIPLNR